MNLFNKMRMAAGSTNGIITVFVVSLVLGAVMGADNVTFTVMLVIILRAAAMVHDRM